MNSVPCIDKKLQPRLKDMTRHTDEQTDRPKTT